MGNNKIIHSLWIGNRLSLLELLTIQSFLNAGHQFHLWLYDNCDTELPSGVVIKDAAEIIPREQIFYYRNRNQFGHGQGSVSGFSDIFRYKLLYEKGGWWVDMDVTCIKPFDFVEEYVFRPHHELKVVGNVMKVPAGSDLMWHCYKQAQAEVTAANTDWHKPIAILNRHIEQLQLERFIQKPFSNEDRWDDVKSYLLANKAIPSYCFCMHWMNEEWRKRRMDKQDFCIGSAYFNLLTKHGLVRDDFSEWNRQKNKWRYRIQNAISNHS